jgi:hypothetical protein
MSPPPDVSAPRVIRVFTPGLPAFQLRAGEEGISVFDPDAVFPPLQEDEIINSFRAGSRSVVRTIEDLVSRGLEVVPVEGADVLPDRLRQAHREIRPNRAMIRADFKKVLKELESHGTE